MGKRNGGKRWQFNPEEYDPEGQSTIFIGAIPMNVKVLEIKESIWKVVPKNIIKHLEIITKLNKKIKGAVDNSDSIFSLGFGFMILNNSKDISNVLQKTIHVGLNKLDMKKAIVGKKENIAPATIEKRVALYGFPLDLIIRKTELEKFMDRLDQNYERIYLPYQWGHDKYKGVAIVDFETKREAEKFLNRKIIQYNSSIWLKITSYKTFQRDEIKSTEMLLQDKDDKNLNFQTIKYNHHMRNLRLNIIKEGPLLDYFENRDLRFYNLE